MPGVSDLLKAAAKGAQKFCHFTSKSAGSHLLPDVPTWLITTVFIIPFSIFTNSAWSILANYIPTEITRHEPTPTTLHLWLEMYSWNIGPIFSAIQQSMNLVGENAPDSRWSRRCSRRPHYTASAPFLISESHNGLVPADATSRSISALRWGGH